VNNEALNTASESELINGEHPSLEYIESNAGRSFLCGLMHGHIMKATMMTATTLPEAVVSEVEKTIISQYAWMKITDFMLYFKLISNGKIQLPYGRINGSLLISMVETHYIPYRNNVIRGCVVPSETRNDGENITFDEYMKRKMEGRIDFQTAHEYIEYSKRGIPEMTDCNGNITHEQFKKMKYSGKIDTETINKRLKIEHLQGIPFSVERIYNGEKLL